MRSTWPARLLPVLQAIAEGGWLGVVYAAAQAAAGDQPRVGALEFALLAGMGMAWARRRRWTSPMVEAAGLPILALVGGLIGWFLDPVARYALVSGAVGVAFASHLPGWLGAIAVVRGGLHGNREDDEAVQDRLLRFGAPALAIPWLIGTLTVPAELRSAFTSAAFISTMVFAVGAFAAMGLARLEATRAATGSRTGGGASGALIALVSLGALVIGVPAAAFLGVPLAVVAALVFGPVRLVLLLGILLSTPLILLVATLTELLRPLLPKGIPFPNIQLPAIGGPLADSVSPIPTIIVVAVVVLLALIELGFLAMVVYLRWQERQRMNAVAISGFEERSIVVPPAQPRPATRSPTPRRRRRRDPRDPVEAYLAAIDALAADERLARRLSETPAAHARRIAEHTLAAPLGRLAIAYQLVRYANRSVTAIEQARGPGRVERVRRAARHVAGADGRAPDGGTGPPHRTEAPL